MPTIPTPEELGGLLHIPGARPIGSYDVSSHAHGAQQIADAGTRFGEAVADVGKAAYKVSQQQAMTEAINANAFIHGRLIEARARFQNDPDYATLPQRWNEEAGKIVDDGLTQISNEGLREHVRHNLAVPLAQESAAIQGRAFRAAAEAHAISRDKYLRNLVDHITLNPNDGLVAGGVDALHSAIDNAVERGLLTAEEGGDEKRRSALALVAGQYARMSRLDPERAIRELESPEEGHPLLAQFPPQLKDSLIQQARQHQENAFKDTEQGALRRLHDIQRTSDQAENEIIADLTSQKPTATRADISGSQKLTPTAKSYMLAFVDRSGYLDPDADTSNAVARRLLDRIRMHDGDPNQITKLDPIYDAYINRSLSRDDFNFVRREFFAKQAPDLAPLLARKQAFLKGIEHAIDRSDPLIGEIDQLGRSKMYLLERDIDRKIEEYRKDGKNPFDLFDQTKPDYVGKPDSLDRYRITLREALEERARQFRAADVAAQSVPPRSVGETPADYLRRTNTVPPSVNESVPLSR